MSAGSEDTRTARRWTARGATSMLTALALLAGSALGAGVAAAAGPPATITMELSARLVRAAADTPPVTATVTVRDAAGELVAPADIPGIFVTSFNVGDGWRLKMRADQFDYDEADGRWHATAYPSTETGRFRVSAGIGSLSVQDELIVGLEPQISNVASMQVLHDTASLVADVLEQGPPTTYHLEWGLASTAEHRSPDQAWSHIYFSDQQRIVLSGLTPSTTYVYRWVATNAIGTSESPVASFTTTAAPVPEPVDPPVATQPRRSVRAAPPALSGARLDPRVIAVRRGTRGGTTLRFTLDRAARVSARIESARRGVRSAGACKPAGRIRRGRACTRWTTAGTLAINGRTGANAVAFSGRAGRRTLPAGHHRLVLTPAGGGKPATVAFTIR